MPATVQFVDIGGLVEGASKGEGLGNKFLANIREVDAIVFVLRAFADDDVPGPSDPLEHLARRRDRAGARRPRDGREPRSRSGARRPSATRRLADEVAALDAAYAVLAEGTPLYRSDLERRRTGPLLRPYFLLTNKPVLAVVNVGEDQTRPIADAVLAPVASRARRARPR